MTAAGKLQHNKHTTKVNVDLSPLTTLGHETRWA